MIGDSITPSRAAALSAALAVLVHLGALTNGFAYDDLVLILGDPGIRQLEGLGARLMQPAWPGAFSDAVGAWRPATTATWALVWAAAGESTIAFHALGVVLHAISTALGVLVLAEIVPLGTAALAGVLFAVHPVHSEAVANVIGSAEPLAAAFALLAALIHVRGGPHYGLLRVALVTVTYSLATLAKESAAVLPLLLFLIDSARRDVDARDLARYVRERFTLYAMMGGALVLILIARSSVLGAIASASHPLGGELLLQAPRVWTVFSTWPHYLRLLFFPAELAANYGPGVIPIIFRWSASAVLGALLGLLWFGGALLAWRHGPALSPESKSGRAVALGLLWIAGAMLPVANLVFLGPVLVAERTLYLPSFGACLAIGWLLVSFIEQRGRVAVVLALVVVLAGAARTVTRVPDWRDTDTIMSALIETHPESGTGWLALGRRLTSQGRPEEALRAFAYSLAFLNSEYRPSTQVAAHLLSLGRVDSARFFLLRAWREHPEFYTAPGLLAAAELNAGRPERAAAAARAATILEPADPSMHLLLAQALSGLGDWPEAAAARRAAIDNGFGARGGTWLQLAQDHMNGGDRVAAGEALDSASLRPLSESERSTLADLRSSLALETR